MAVDVGAVGAFQVDDDELAFFEDDLGVAFGDVAFGENDIVSLDPSDGDLVLVELQSLGFSTLFLDHNGKHGSLVLVR